MGVLRKSIQGGREGALAVRATIEKIDRYLKVGAEDWESCGDCAFCVHCKHFSSGNDCKNCPAFRQTSSNEPCLDWEPINQSLAFAEARVSKSSVVQEQFATAARAELQSLLDKWIKENGPLDKGEDDVPEG